MPGKKSETDFLEFSIGPGKTAMLLTSTGIFHTRNTKFFERYLETTGMSQDFPFERFLKTSPLQETAPLIKKNLENLNTYGEFGPMGATPQTTTEQVHLNNESNLPNLLGNFDIDELDAINMEVQNQLIDSISTQKYKTYFENTFTLTNIAEDMATFSVTTPFIKTIVENHYLDQIKKALFQVLGKRFQVVIDVIESKKSLSSNKNNILNSINKEKTTTLAGEVLSASKPKTAKEAKFTLDLTPTQDDLKDTVESKYLDHMNPEPTGILIDNHKTFNSFIVGPSNNLACATAKAVAQNPGKTGKYPSLYIHSNSGLGKTHLLHAVANEIREHFPRLAICLITARDFMTEMINSIQNNNITEFRKKYSEKIDVLMIDDIHELKDKQGTQNEFFHIFNELHNKGKQLIFTSDKSPKEIDGITERIKTRLQWGLVIDIQRPDLETRIAILKRKAYELDLYVPDDVLNLIACSIKTSIRELEGSLIKLSAFADVMKIEIDVEMVKDLLNLQPEEERKVTLESIAKATSQYFKVPVADLKSKARSKDIAKARHIAMYLSRKIVGATQQEIGRFYGGRDHSSVIHAVRTITDKIKKDADISKDVLYIETQL